MRKNTLQCTLCAAKSLRKTPWGRRWFWCFWFSPTSPGWKQMTRARIVHKQPLACVISAHVLGKVRAKTSLFDLTVSSERTLPCASKEHNGKTQTGWRKKGVFIIINCERLSKMSYLSKIYFSIWPFQLTNKLDKMEQVHFNVVFRAKWRISSICLEENTGGILVLAFPMAHIFLFKWTLCAGRKCTFKFTMANQLIQKSFASLEKPWRKYQVLPDQK